MSSKKVQKNYLSLLSKLKISKEALNEDSDLLECVLKESNELFNSVNNTSGLKLDAKVTELHSDIFLKSFNRNIQKKKIDTNKFINQLNLNELSEYFLKLEKINKRCVFTNFIDFNYNTVEVKRKATERISRVVKDAQTPEQNLMIQEEVNSFFVYLEKCFKKKQKLLIYECILDLKSFDKTIENIFNLSIAMRSKIVEFQIVDSKMYIVPYKGSTDKKEDHLVFDIDYSSYCSIRDKYRN